MRKKTVRSGLVYLLAGMISLILASFYHSQAAWIFTLSAGDELRFTLLGFVIGGIFGATGVLLSVLGLIQRPTPERDVRLMPVLIMLAVAILFFVALFYRSLSNPEPPRLGPGETITI